MDFENPSVWTVEFLKPLKMDNECFDSSSDRYYNKTD
jgi:hypothetical protein